MEDVPEASGGGQSVSECAEGFVPHGDAEGCAAKAEAVEAGEHLWREAPRGGEERAVGFGGQAAEGVGSEQPDVGAQKERERIKELIRPLVIGYPNGVAVIGVPKWECFEVLCHPA